MYRLLIVDESVNACEQITQRLDWAAYGFSGIMTATSYMSLLFVYRIRSMQMFFFHIIKV